MVKKKWLVAGIDVGTTKICSTIGEVEDDKFEILGTGWSPSNGLKKGVIVNLSETIECLKSSVAEAEAQSDKTIESAYVSVGGAYLKGFNAVGRTDVRGKASEIAIDDIDRAVAAAKDFRLPDDYQIIHSLTQDFNVDGQGGIINPLGMNGRHLAVNLHLVVNASAIVQNIANAINKAGIFVNGVVMQQMASAESILTPDEKEMGSVVVDIGGGTSDIVAYNQGSISYSEVLPLGGNMITKDIAIGLKIPLQEAEELKKALGHVIPESVPEEEHVEVSEIGSGRYQTIERRYLCGIIQARCDEMLKAIAVSIEKISLSTDLFTGVVLTGGGALLAGLTERAEEIFDFPVRVGYPVNVAAPTSKVYHPAYCTALGLLKYARDIQGAVAEGDAYRQQKNLRSREQGPAERVRNWLLEKIS